HPLVEPATPCDSITSATTHPSGLEALSTPAEIVELANALGQGGTCTGTCFAALAYQYVRNNIAVEFRFGLGKGGRGALIDQSGTPFDQAQLFIALLRQAGITTASYQVGTVTL